MTYTLIIRLPDEPGLSPTAHAERLDAAPGPRYYDAPATEDPYWPGLYRADLRVDLPGLYAVSLHACHGGSCRGVAYIESTISPMP